MEFHRHTQWLVRGHQGTTPAFSPMASRSQGPRQGERREASCNTSSTTEDTSKGPVEGWAPRSSLASFGAGVVQCQICSGGGFEDSEGGVSKASAPTAKSGRSVRTCGEARGSVETFGRGRPRCRTFEDCIETGEESSSSASSWGALRSVPPVYLSSKETSSQGRGARPRSQRSPGSDGGEVGQWVARFGGPPCRSVGRASTAPFTGCCTTRDGGGTQRGDRQVAELQKERVQEVEANRTKKARSLAGSCTDLAHYQGGHSAQNPSEVMSTLIDAADSTLRDAGRGVQRHQGSIGE